MRLSNQIVGVLEQILNEEGELFTSLVAERFRNEVPLQEKIFKRLESAIPSLVREKPYADSLDKCDFWSMSNDGNESWVELKLCPTNYCGKFGRSKTIAITQQIGQVVHDCKKLARIDASYERRVLLMAYPMPIGDDHPQWSKHTDWILEKSKNIKRKFQHLLILDNEEAAINVYEINV